MNVLKSQINDSPSFDVLLASLYYLMTRHAREPSLTIAKSIAENFELISRHQHCDSDVLKRVGRRLSRHWAHIICQECQSRSKTQLEDQKSLRKSDRSIHYLS